MTLQVPVMERQDSRVRAEPEWRSPDEHPSVVLRDLVDRRRPAGHIIAFANEKGGVGKSTLAFQCAVALAHRGKKVIAIDCDSRQQSLHRLFEARDGAIRTLKVDLPRPRHTLLAFPTGSMLLQELDRVGMQSDFVVIDLPGHDSPIVRRAIAVADTVVTPVNSSALDLDSLGAINPVTRRLRGLGPFAEVVSDLRDERIERGMDPFEWIVVKNRVRHCEKRLIHLAEQQLEKLSRLAGFRVVEGLTERVVYRELLPFGLSQMDLKHLPWLQRPRSVPVKELRAFVAGLRLPIEAPSRTAADRRFLPRAPVLSQVVERYRRALGAASLPEMAD